MCTQHCTVLYCTVEAKANGGKGQQQAGQGKDQAWMVGEKKKKKKVSLEYQHGRVLYTLRN